MPNLTDYDRAFDDYVLYYAAERSKRVNRRRKPPKAHPTP